MLRTAYPDASRSEIEEFLRDEIEASLRNPKCTIDNNYLKKRFDTTLLDVIDWIRKTKPICAGNGVFFRDQHTISSALSATILKFMALRKEFKGLLKVYVPETYEYDTADRKQRGVKRNTNSIYGCCGNKTAFLYNLYTAQAITRSGQSLISTTEMAFESFLCNNVAFNSMAECMTFLNNVRHDKISHSARILPDVSVARVMSRLKSMFYRESDAIESVLYRYLSNLNQLELNRIFFKNNLYDFSSIPMIQKKIRHIFYKTKDFKDPNKVPKESKDDLEDLWSYYRDFVMYNHSPINRIQRLKNDKRRCIITIDTDSNFVSLDPWVKFIERTIINQDHELSMRDRMEMRFISVNTLTYMITNMMACVLGRYSEISNIPEDFRSYINIKNEFLYSRIILTPKKKRYIGTIRLREGSEIYPEKIDAKGLDFMKSTASVATESKFTRIIKDRLLQIDTISPRDLLHDLFAMEAEVTNSLLSGEKTYLAPKSVKELGAYKDPFKEQGVRAVYAWNAIYPDRAIDLPAKVDIVKLNICDESALEQLRTIDPEVYERVVKKIFKNPNDKISKKGLQVLAIPKNVERVPEWAGSFIDVDTSVFNVLKKFYPILLSVGFKIPSVSKKEFFSNIIDV